MNSTPQTANQAGLQALPDEGLSLSEKFSKPNKDDVGPPATPIYF